MIKWISAATVAAVVSTALPAVAGPNLGMKLACKHYGDAWNSGSRGALYGQISGDFAHVFQRMPDHMFNAMPRGGSGQVLSSSKGGGSGQVTVSTSQGVMTFILAGGGFNWTVVDIYKSGDDGRTVSLKSYLDASIVSYEFIRDFGGRRDNVFLTSTSSQFRKACNELSTEELSIVRDLIPEVGQAGKPYIAMNGSRATMSVNLPHQRSARFQLIHEGSWKVDDYSIESPNMSIASFRNSLGSLVAVQRFRNFMTEPTSSDPRKFTAEGELRDSLVRIHEIGFLPMHQKPSPMRHCSIDAKGEKVVIDLTDRHVRIALNKSATGAVVSKVDITMGKSQWADLAHLIALNERIRKSMSFIGIANPTIPATAAVAKEVASTVKNANDSVLTNASAVEIEKPAPVVKKDENVKPVVAQTLSTTPSQSVIQSVGYAPQQPTYRVYKSRRFHRHRGW